jgi:hypothetical protein
LSGTASGELAAGVACWALAPPTKASEAIKTHAFGFSFDMPSSPLGAAR